MTTNADIQVWLETIARTNPDIIVPYVQSTENDTLQYKVQTVREGAQGRSNMAQSGTIRVLANTATPLVQMSVTHLKQDVCHIEIVISDGRNIKRNYHFNCPAP